MSDAYVVIYDPGFLFGLHASLNRVAYKDRQLMTCDKTGCPKDLTIDDTEIRH